jgi:hypothetical protein
VLRAPQPLPCWLPVVAWRKITVDLCFFWGFPWGITSWMVYFMEKPIEMDDLGIPLWIGNLRYLWPKAKWAGNHELWMLYKQKTL